MKQTAILIAPFCVLLASCAHTGGGSDRQPARDDFAMVEAGLEDADRLYRSGISAGEPVMMGLAAEMRADLLGSWSPAGDQSGGVLSPEEMMSRARETAGKDALALAYLDRIEGRRTRGRTDGPAVRHIFVSSQAAFADELAFQGGLPAVIYAEGEPEADFVLTVGAAGGTGIECSDPAKPRQVCRWHPKEPQTVSVRISTDSEQPVELLFITN